MTERVTRCPGCLYEHTYYTAPEHHPKRVAITDLIHRIHPCYPDCGKESTCPNPPV
jgi:hypothetical protein